MATINKTIEHVDGLKPNTFDPEAKFNWLRDLDGMICRTVMQQEFVPYKYPGDMDKELLVGSPYEGIYALYLEAQIDRYNQEYNEYNNTITAFNALLDDFKKAYIRAYMPKAAGPIRGL